MYIIVWIYCKIKVTHVDIDAFFRHVDVMPRVWRKQAGVGWVMHGVDTENCMKKADIDSFI